MLEGQFSADDEMPEISGFAPLVLREFMERYPPAEGEKWFLADEREFRVASGSFYLIGVEAVSGDVLVWRPPENPRGRIFVRVKKAQLEHPSSLDGAIRGVVDKDQMIHTLQSTVVTETIRADNADVDRRIAWVKMAAFLLLSACVIVGVVSEYKEKIDGLEQLLKKKEEGERKP